MAPKTCRCGTKMIIEGLNWVCPQCTRVEEFPKRKPTEKEWRKIVEDKDLTIAELEQTIKEQEDTIECLRKTTNPD